MRKYFAAVAFAIAGLSAFASFGAATAPLQSSTRPETAAPAGTPQEARNPNASYRVADNWNDRLCCKRGNREWWTIRRDCQNAGGYQTTNKACRENEGGGFSIDLNLGSGARVCCQRGWQDWWTTWGACRRAGGNQTRPQECRDDWNDSWDQRWWGWTGGNWENRICCKRGNRDWWSTARECRNAFGYQTENRECRDERGDDDWNRRVCCKRGNNDWWTSLRECRQANGYEAERRECRDDRGNNDEWQDPFGRPDRRVCCYKDRRAWWASARDCHYAWGEETANKVCRNN